MKAIKESPKKIIPWSAFYFTNPEGSWYPPAENKLSFQCDSPTLSQRESPTFIEKATSEQLQLLSTTETKTVRQRNVGQKTTMTKSGTLLYYLHSVQIRETA